MKGTSQGHASALGEALLLSLGLSGWHPGWGLGGNSLASALPFAGSSFSESPVML